MTEIRLADEYFPLVASGSKTSTARFGDRDFPIGRALLRGRSAQVQVTITNLRKRHFGDLDQNDARRDGFGSVEEMQAALRKFYPGISADDVLTIVEFTTR